MVCRVTHYIHLTATLSLHPISVAVGCSLQYQMYRIRIRIVSFQVGSRHLVGSCRRRQQVAAGCRRWREVAVPVASLRSLAAVHLRPPTLHARFVERWPSYISCLRYLFVDLFILFILSRLVLFFFFFFFLRARASQVA